MSIHEPKDLPSLKEMDKYFPLFKLISSGIAPINLALRALGIKDSKIQLFREDIKKLIIMKEEIKSYPTKYNRYFGKKGWIAYDSMNNDSLKKAVDLYEEGNEKGAENEIVSMYSADKIEDSLILFKHAEEFNKRYKFIEYALNDYKEKRYYSCIPILIMMIDGIVSDVVGKGFHADKVDLKVWDSLTATDTGINKLKDLFQTSRTKTSTEKLSLPFRHGILHGRDLGYDNFEVAVKCWSYLFVVRDWLNSKKSEPDRLKKYEKENKPTTFKKLKDSRLALDDLKKALNEWSPRSFNKEDFDVLNEESIAKKGTPEELVLNFLSFWKNKNYGGMANLYASIMIGDDSIGKFAGGIRTQFEYRELISYKIKTINDFAAGITLIVVSISLIEAELVEKDFEFRCIYEKEISEEINNVLVRGTEGGVWRLIHGHSIT